MSFFTPDYEKPGPGIPKDAPTKKGLALFFEILIREFWQLIKLNLIFVISCIPIITVGPAISGMTRSVTKMVRDVPNDVLEDFKDGFRDDMKTSIIYGILGLILFGGGFLGIILYTDHPILQMMSFIFLIFLANIWIYIFPLKTSTTLDPAVWLRNAFLLSAIQFYYSIPTAILCLLFFGAQLFLFPFSIPLSLFLGFSIPCFISCFAAWSGIKRYIIKENNDHAE